MIVKRKNLQYVFGEKKSLIHSIFFTFLVIFPPFPLIFRKGNLHKVMSVNLHPFFPDQIKMAVFFWHLLKSDLVSVRYCMYTRTLDKSLYKVPETRG